MSRPLIELVVRRRVERHANITLRPRCRVCDLVPSADRAAVIAVCFENGDGKSETLPADVVVDASGRGSLTRSLLESIGQPMPEETVIGVDIGYATAVFAIPDDGPSRLESDADDSQHPGEQPRRPDVAAGGRQMDGDHRRPARRKTTRDGMDFWPLCGSSDLDPLRHHRQTKRLGDVIRFGFSGSVWRHFERSETSRAAASIQRRNLPLQPRVTAKA